MHTPYLPCDSSLDIEASKTHAQRGCSFLVSTTARYYKNLGDTLRCCIPNTYMLLVGRFKETTLLANLETPVSQSATYPAKSLAPQTKLAHQAVPQNLHFLLQSSIVPSVPFEKTQGSILFDIPNTCLNQVGLRLAAQISES